MARFTTRRWIRFVSLALVLSAGVVWLVHGRVLFTVTPISEDPQGRALERLFEPTGVQDELGAVRGMDGGFRLGILPSGFGASLISVAMVFVIAAMLWALSSGRRPSGAFRRDRCRRPACP